MLTNSVNLIEITSKRSTEEVAEWQFPLGEARQFLK